MKGCRGSSADNCPLVTRAARGINHLGGCLCAVLPLLAERAGIVQAFVEFAA